jgi:hypothetical protein
MDLFDRFMDWTTENGFVGFCCFVGVVLVAALVFCVLVDSLDAWYNNLHPCTSWSEPHYHAPVYVMSGKVMIPIGAGTSPDCLSRK